jgi:hypothetical protein
MYILLSSPKSNHIIIIFFVLILFLNFSTYSLELKCAEISNKEFLVASAATIITEQDQETTDFLLSNNITIKLACEEKISYKVTKYKDHLIKWEFFIPNNNCVVGEGKELKFDDGSNKSAIIKINIYAKKPILYSSEPTSFYSDFKEPQTLKLFLNKVSYVDKVEFISPKVIIKGTKTSEITADNPYLNIDSVNNVLAFDFFPNDTSKIYKIIFHYRDNSFKSKQSDDTAILKISLEKSKLKEQFQIVHTTKLYFDDFTENMDKKVSFNFNNKGKPKKKYRIEVEGFDLNIVTNEGGDIDFIMPDTGIQKVDVKIDNVKSCGKFPIKVYSNANDTLYSTLNIMKKPNITSIIISNSSGNKTIIKELGEIYHIKILGDDLHLMSDVQVELVNANTSEFIELKKEETLEENCINTNIYFDSAKIKKMIIGDYYLRLSRKIGDNGELRKLYPFTQSLISIIYPKKPTSELLSISLDNPHFFKRQGFQKPNKKYKYFYPSVFTPLLFATLNKILIPNGDDTLNQDRNAGLDQYIVDSKSPLVLKISSNNNDPCYSPQYLNISAKYVKADGNETISKVSDNGNNYIVVYNKPLYIDIKNELNIDELNANEKVIIKVEHSPEIYGTSKLTRGRTIECIRGFNVSDNIGITFSFPPYLVAFRNMRVKEVKSSENNDTIITYTGEKDINFQTLTINAGLGLKYRPIDDHYNPSKFAAGFYIMGLDFTNVNDYKSQKNDPKDNSFIARGSFNAMFLIEYSLINLNNPTTRLPIYFGGMYIFKPIDGDGHINWKNYRHYAGVFGIGIDISLLGKK